MNTRHFSPNHLLPALLLLVGLIMLLYPQPALSQQPDALRMDARAGYDGFYKTAEVVPVQVLVANDGPPIEGEIRIQVGSEAVGDVVVYTAPVSLPTQSSKRVPLLIYVPRITDQLTVELRDENQAVVTTAVTPPLSLLARDNTLVGVVSPDPAEFSALEQTQPDGSRTAVAFLTLDDVAETAVALTPLDILILDDIDSTRLTPAQLNALEAWVSTGGQLVITGGPNWQATTAAFTDLLPVTPTGTATVDDLPALAEAAGTPFRDAGPYLVAESSLQQGELLLHQDGLPLLAARDLGQGRVLFLALDPKLAPLVDWDGAAVVWTAVADGNPSHPVWASGFQNDYTLRESVASLPAISLPSVLALVAFLLVYVIIIGPVNYLVLKRLNRRELAWVTIPVLVLIFGGLTYLFGFQIKGNNTILNQMTVYVGEVGSEYGRVKRAIGLYAPSREVYQLSLSNENAARPDQTGFGISQTNFDTIERSGSVTYTDVRMDVGEIALFTAVTIAPLPDLTASAELGFDGANITVDINVQNNSDVGLSDLSVLAGDNAYELPDLPPGASLSQRLPLPLTGSTAVGPRPSGPAPLSNNAPTILRSSDYYSDDALYARWQLLLSLENNTTTAVDRTNIVTLVGWSDSDPGDVVLSDTAERSATALYLLDMPLAGSVTTGESITVPAALLDWEVITADGIFEPTITNVYLNGGQMDVAYRPWAQFDDLAVESLAVVVEPVTFSEEVLVPQVWLWNWETESWELLEAADWGTTVVATVVDTAVDTSVDNPIPYLGENNTVRIRLIDQSPFGVEVREVYPELTGRLNGR